MRWHLIEGEEGCRFAVDHGCVAIVVDALRASATATMLLDAGAIDVLVVREIDEALKARSETPEALLFGERGGLPPPGFDYGNSPRDAAAAAGKRVIFTTTTGAGRLISCWRAHLILMGSPLNARAVAEYAMKEDRDIVVVPAGLAGDPSFDAQEDWAGAATIVMEAPNANIGEGSAQYAQWRERILEDGLPRLFEESPHAEKLRRVGLGADIAYCAQLNTTCCVPTVFYRFKWGLGLVDARSIPTGDWPNS